MKWRYPSYWNFPLSGVWTRSSRQWQGLTTGGHRIKTHPQKNLVWCEVNGRWDFLCFQWLKKRNTIINIQKTYRLDLQLSQKQDSEIRLIKKNKREPKTHRTGSCVLPDLTTRCQCFSKKERQAWASTRNASLWWRCFSWKTHEDILLFIF